MFLNVFFLISIDIFVSKCYFLDAKLELTLTLYSASRDISYFLGLADSVMNIHIPVLN